VTHRCSLCGYGFEEAEMREVRCKSCPASPLGCGLVRCPACGYEWPPESSSWLINLVKKLFTKKGATS
jgi:rubredoxin